MMFSNKLASTLSQSVSFRFGNWFGINSRVFEEYIGQFSRNFIGYNQSPEKLTQLWFVLSSETRL